MLFFAGVDKQGYGADLLTFPANARNCPFLFHPKNPVLGRLDPLHKDIARIGVEINLTSFTTAYIVVEKINGFIF